MSKLEIRENTELIDDSPENRIDQEDLDVQPRSTISIVILIVVLLLCIVGFSYGMYRVLH